VRGAQKSAPLQRYLAEYQRIPSSPALHAMHATHSVVSRRIRQAFLISQSWEDCAAKENKYISVRLQGQNTEKSLRKIKPGLVI